MSQKAKIVSLEEYLAPITIIGQGINKADFKYKILAEGDSWFNFNRLAPEENLLQHLEFEKNTIIVNVALSGSTVKKMAAGSFTPFFKKALDEEKFDLILLSSGGNDLIAAFCGGYDYTETRKLSLLHLPETTDPDNYINETDHKILKEEIKKNVLSLLEIRNTSIQNKETPALIHCYDYFTMRNNIESDSPRYDRFITLGIAPKLWPTISDFLVKQLSLTLKSIGGKTNNLTVVDTLDCLDRADSLKIGNSNDWRNEIHPNHKGYEKLSKSRMNPAIKKVLS